MLNHLLKSGAYLAVFVAILVHVFLFTEIPRHIGVYRLLKQCAPPLEGLSPAFADEPWGFSFEDLNKQNLSGQRALVTGANSGIGYEVARQLAKLGAEVTLACRSVTKCAEAAASIQKENPKGPVMTTLMDMASLASVRESAHEYMLHHGGKALDMLFLNAGYNYVPKKDGPKDCVPITADGMEEMFQVNYLSHHFLYKLLEPMLKRSDMARVVSTSSGSSFSTYSYRVATDLETLNGCKEPFMKGMENLSYGQSKLAQIVWSKALTKRLGPNSNIYVNAFHPGLVRTPLVDKIFSEAPFMLKVFDKLQSVLWSTEEGALTGHFLGVAKDRLASENIRGKYFHPQSKEVINELALDERLQEDLWNFSESLVQKFMNAENTATVE
ncbi:hypothetical protein FisN_2Hh211 [Fistulifera solaris]|jgi:NAD(P)-dependent dehydrogenase (short-subunit alcohol dehydrogenase family)|uniref:Uncharacterized protein n=1 Tax=Fistulifera solaris TaxID=1519565 RepID=A0A1Z5KK15_FISSO|nr:hypothetical protein FisN_2Hh211 [Fistulifera solaris]|eukprot:GAX26371.1 hypothetical protein FisN_2Hh211 [Fistulifera solaris]